MANVLFLWEGAMEIEEEVNKSKITFEQSISKTIFTCMRKREERVRDKKTDRILSVTDIINERIALHHIISIQCYPSLSLLG